MSTNLGPPEKTVTLYLFFPGKIYALLGSSGCGKTTLLRIILGRMSPKKGKIEVFGQKPGVGHCNIPGSGVGYMPQELALTTAFTIEETLYYYGLLHHMSKPEIDEKTDFFVEFLNLPPKDRQVAQCSGGQQRRVSIATTLLHDPPLLILDEPTVGVDPLLRCKIWQYLEYLCMTKSELCSMSCSMVTKPFLPHRHVCYDHHSLHRRIAQR